MMPDSPEIKTLIRYGFVDQEQAGQLEEPAASARLNLKVFGKREDSQWSMGAGGTKAESIGLSSNSHAARGYRKKLYSDALKARVDGKTPFRVAGPPDAFPEFLEQVRVVEIEFVV